MPSPNPSALIENLRPDITGMFEEFSLEMNAMRMIALQVFPVFEAGLQAGPFGKITIASLMKAVETARNSGGAYNMTEFEFTTDTYATKENGISVPVDKRNAQIYRNYFQAEVVAARLARHKVMLGLEQRVAAKLFNTSTFNTTAKTTDWATIATAVPLTDVEAAVQRLYDKGIIANALVMSWKTFRNLRNTAQVIDRITSNGAGNPSKAEDVTLAMLAAVFDLPKIIVGGAQYNAANEGQAASLSSVWSNNYVAVTRITDGPLEDPGVGRIFHWGDDGSTIGGTMESWYDTEIRGDKVRCRMETDEKVMYTAAAELISIH